jgi:nucleotide-binding universal stress UspA family protein
MKILVPMDDSEMAERALEYALENHPDPEITVLHVVGEPTPMWGGATGLALEENLEEAAEERATEVFDGARDVATEYSVEITTEVRLGHPVRAIINRAAEFDVVVLGTHGGSLADQLIIGNVAKKVFRRSPVPVTVVR